MQETNQNNTEKNINSVINKLKKPDRKLFPIIISSISLVVVILLIGGGALLAGRVWDPSWNPFHNRNNRNNQSFVSNISQSFSDIIRIFYRK